MGYKNYKLTVIKGFNKGTVFPLEADHITIGRGEENGIILNIAEVSMLLSRHLQAVVFFFSLYLHQ